MLGQQSGLMVACDPSHQARAIFLVMLDSKLVLSNIENCVWSLNAQKLTHFRVTRAQN